MKLKLVWFTVFLCMFNHLFSQNTIAGIDTLISQMAENQNMYEIEEKMSSEQGHRWVYYLNNEPRIIKVQESGRIEKNVAWYYIEGKLIYTETNWIDSANNRTVHQEKTYHAEEGMIVWIDSESSFVDASSDEFKNLEKALKAYGKEIYQSALK